YFGMFLDKLRARARARPRRVVLPEARDARVLAAAAQLATDRLAVPVLLGDGLDTVAGCEHLDPKSDLRRREFAEVLFTKRKEKGLDREKAWELAADPLIFGALLVAGGHADCGVSGSLSTTANVLRAGIWCIGLRPSISAVSSAFEMVWPNRVLTYG